MQDFANELAEVCKSVGYQIREQYYFETLKMVQDLGSPELLDASVPLEAWSGIAQAMADSSGYRLVFEAAVVEELSGCPDTLRISESIEVTNAPAYAVQRRKPQDPVM